MLEMSKRHVNRVFAGRLSPPTGELRKNQTHRILQAKQRDL